MDLNHRNKRNRRQKTGQRHTSQSTAHYRTTKMREVQMAGQNPCRIFVTQLHRKKALVARICNVPIKIKNGIRENVQFLPSKTMYFTIPKILVGYKPTQQDTNRLQTPSANEDAVTSRSHIWNTRRLKNISRHIPVTLTHKQPRDVWPNIHCLCTDVSHTDVHYIRIFPKTYVCENGYSKSKNQYTLHVELDINLKLSTL
jgi:hypothetical protein